MTNKKKSKFIFEKSLKNLEDITHKLESTSLSLEDSLKFFEKGITLAKECEQHLKNAEQQVEILSNQLKSDKNEDDFETESFS